MAQPAEKHPWFAPTSFQVSSDDLDSKSKGPSEFERLWRGTAMIPAVVRRGSVAGRRLSG